jgi:hypothetical protein
MTAIACHALTQNSVRCQYCAPSCPVYVHLPPLVRHFPLLLLLKAIGAGLITCILVLRSASSPLPADTTHRAYIATSFTYAFCIFAHYDIRTISRYFLLPLSTGNGHIAESPSNSHSLVQLSIYLPSLSACAT